MSAPKWLEVECKALVTFVKADTRGLLFGTGAGAGGEAVKRKMWEKASEAIRAAGGWRGIGREYGRSGKICVAELSSIRIAGMANA